MRSAWRSGEMRTTFHARPSFSMPRMTSAERSTSYQRRPWAAERGNAWWLWCHASPSEGTASQATFVEWSSTSKRSEEHTSEVQSRQYLVCRLLLEKKKDRDRSGGWWASY